MVSHFVTERYKGEGGRAILLHCVTRRVGGVKFPQKVRYVTFECSLNACVSAWGGEGGGLFRR